MNARRGKRRERITVEVATETIDTRGERTQTWGEYDRLWAEINPQMIDPVYMPDGSITKHLVLFAIDYSSNNKAINTDDYRIVWDGNVYDIEAIPPPLNTAKRIELQAIRRD